MWNDCKLEAGNWKLDVVDEAVRLGGSSRVIVQNKLTIIASDFWTGVYCI